MILIASHLCSVMSPIRQSIGSFAKASRRISVRLRFGFFLIAAFTAAAALISIDQARAVQSANRALNGVGLPMYRLAQVARQDLQIMLHRLEELDQSKTEAEILLIEENTRTDAAALTNDLLRFEALTHSQKASKDLVVWVKEVETALLLDAQNRRALYQMDAQLADKATEIDRVIGQQRHIVTKMSTNLSGQTEHVLHGVRANAAVLASDIDLLVSDLFLTSVNLGSIRDALETIADSVSVLANNHQVPNAARQQLIINRKLQYIVGRMVEMPQGKLRLDLARQTSGLRELLAGPDGFFEALDERHAFLTEIATRRESQKALIAGLTTTMSDMVTDTLQGVGESAVVLNTAVQRTMMAISIGFLAIILTISVISQLIVVNQFTKRIRSLTGSVAAIAHGRLDHPITISGPDELGDMAGALAVFRENARDLRRSNIDLEKFAYVAAHDLRSPLTAIADLGDWIAEDQDNRLTAQSSAFLQLMQKRTQRLQHLLRDLLNYARVGQDVDAPVSVDLARLIPELAIQCDKTGRFHIHHVGLDEPIQAHETALRQICTNLIENALKHHDKDRGTITIKSELAQNVLVLSVSDDGPGIAPRYQEQVFELFQTLKPRDEVEGSGLGLAIVAKLAARHNGSVRVHSDPEHQRGCQFVVHLPLQTNAAKPPEDPDRNHPKRRSYD